MIIVTLVSAFFLGVVAWAVLMTFMFRHWIAMHNACPICEKRKQLRGEPSCFDDGSAS